MSYGRASFGRRPFGFGPEEGPAVTLAYARPDADVTDAGWTKDTGGNTDLYQSIDEDPASDTDYIRSATLASGDSADVCEVALGDLTDPGVDTGHTIGVRFRKTDVDGVLRMDFDVSLYQGGTLIATRGWDDIGTSFSTLYQTLLTTEADDIADYTDLRLRFSASTPAGNNPAISYIGTANEASSASVATFSSQSIGTAAADRQVVVAVTLQENATISQVAIDGQALTPLRVQQDTGSNPDMTAGIYAIAWPSGTTGTIAVTLSTADDQVAISVYRLTGAAATPSDTDAASGSAASIAIAGLTIPTAGVALYCFANNTNGTAVTWTNGTEQNDVNISAGSTHRHSTATRATAGTVTTTVDGATANQALVGVAWGKAQGRVDVSWAELAAPDAGGGLTAAVNAAASGAVAIGKTVNKLIAVGATTSVATLRGAAKSLAASCAAAVAGLRQAGKALAVAAATSTAVAASRAFLKTIGAAAATTVDLVRTVGFTIAAGAVTTPAFVRSTAKQVAATALGSVAWFAPRQVLRAIAATCSTGVTLARAASKSLAVAASTTAAVNAIRVFLQAVGASVSTATTWQRQAGKGLAIPASAGVTLGRVAGKTLAVAAGAATTVRRASAKLIAATAATAASVAASRAFLRAIAAGCSTGVSLARQAGKSLAVAAQAGVVVNRAKTILRLVAVAAAATVALPRATAKGVAAAASTGVQVARAVTIGLLAAASAGVAVLRQVGKRLAVSAAAQALVDATLGTGELFLVVLNAAVGTGVTLGKGVAKRLAVAVGVIAWLFPPYRKPKPDPRHSPFAQAMGALLADPNLAVPAVYTPQAGPSIALRLVLAVPDQDRPVGRTGAVLRVVDAMLGADDLAAANAGQGPREGDTLTIGDRTYRVRRVTRDGQRVARRVRLELVP